MDDMKVRSLCGERPCVSGRVGAVRSFPNLLPRNFSKFRPSISYVVNMLAD